MTALRYNIMLIMLVLLGTSNQCFAMSNLTRNDPFPVYTTEDPYSFLTIRERQAIKHYELYGKPERARLSFSAFRQSASCGSGLRLATNCAQLCNLNVPDTNCVELGNLLGHWNVLGLFYPEGSSQDVDVALRLDEALGITEAELLNCLFTTSLVPEEGPKPQGIAQPNNSDANKEFGFFSVPIKYRKYGIRFEAEIGLFDGFGLIIQGGVCDLKQTASFVDLTCGATGLSCPVSDCSRPCDIPAGTSALDEGELCAAGNCCIDIFSCECKTLVMNKIMKQFNIVAKTVGSCIRDYHEIDAEDTRVSLYWRHMYEVNKDRVTWPYFIIMPFLVAQASFPTSNAICHNNLFALPAGNDGHFGYGFDAGFTIDFVETVQIGFDAAMTRFSKKTHTNYPVPTNQLQAGIFPHLATVCITPGTNWSFGATLNAYHFIDRLSLYAQYRIISHGENCFDIISTDAAHKSNILTSKLREESLWRVQLANVGLNYDISPNITLGFLWQAPIARRNAYRSTTIMGSLVVTF